MTDSDDAPLFRNPFTLLYWRLCRPRALRRYAQSIHADLYENLEVWQVRQAVGDDPRFLALSRTRRALLVAVPLGAVIFAGSLCLLFGVTFAWQSAALYGISYTAGTAFSDALLWRSSHHEEWMLPLAALLCLGMVVLGVLGIFGLGLVLFLGHFNLPALPASESFSPVAVGVAVGMTFGMISGVTGEIGEVFVVVSLLLAVAGGIDSVGKGMAFGIAFGVGSLLLIFLLVFLHLPLYLLWELPRCLFLSNQAKRQPQRAAALWRKQPVHYDEVIYLPLFGLDTHLAAIANTDPQACKEALTNLRTSLQQQWALPRALSLILSAELRRCSTLALIERFHEATAWLPMDLVAEEEQELLSELHSISRDTARALANMDRKARQFGLQTQIERLQAQRLHLGYYDHATVRAHAEPLMQWQRVLEAEVHA